MFAVDDIDAALAGLRTHGAELIGEVVQYEDSYRLCYVRGPAGIIVALAEELELKRPRRRVRSGALSGRNALDDRRVEVELLLFVAVHQVDVELGDARVSELGESLDDAPPPFRRSRTGR